MTEEHEKLLDFILPILSEKYPDGDTLNSLAHKYKKEKNISHDYQDLRLLKDLYDNDLFEVYKDSNYIRITPKAKEIIVTHGSLSEYLQAVNKENTKARKRSNLTTISPILIAFALLIVTIIFGINNNKLGSKIDKLENEIIKKDSLILELNNQIKDTDTLRIKVHKLNKR